MANTATLPSKPITQPKETAGFSHQTVVEHPVAPAVPALSQRGEIIFQKPSSPEITNQLPQSPGNVMFKIEDVFGNENDTTDYSPPSSQQRKFNRDQQVALATGKTPAK